MSQAEAEKAENAAPGEEDDLDKDDENLSDAGDGDGDDADAKQDYVKKEFVARPWACTSGVLEEVEESIVKENRPRVKIRVSRPRKDFCQEISLAEREAQEHNYEIKANAKNIHYVTNKKVLDIGLQAASKIERIQTQTYFGRLVNKTCQYDPKDFMDGDKKKKRKRPMPGQELTEEEQKKFEDEMKAENERREKLEKFVERVAYDVEAALQSNEIINVFQEDFEMLGDEEAAKAGKVNTTSMHSRTFIDNDYCKGKRVSCIKFHPTKPYLVAMSLVDNMDFELRSKITGKSFESYVLVLNFGDSNIITLHQILETPVEITSIEFHPENPHVLFGGCLNGQIIVWDTSCSELKIQTQKKDHQPSGEDGEDAGALPDEDSNEKSQTAVKMRSLCMSGIAVSHKNFVSDIQFVPPTVNVTRNQNSEGKTTHFISVSEDGIANFWDSRQCDKHEVFKNPDNNFKPVLRLELQKLDGSTELGLVRVLLQKEQKKPVFWGASDEGELCLIDWSMKPINQGDDGIKPAEYVRFSYDSEHDYRPTLALERSPFFEDLLLTVHNFHFCLWKTTLDDYNQPIFRSAMTFGAHNTCGAFSPTRPGVIFITKTNGFDVWDFLEQSNKPSLTFNFATSPMYMTFQYYKHADHKQFMAYGDRDSGTLFLYEVPATLKNKQENEEENIAKQWDLEIQKCLYVIEQREEKKEYYANLKAERERQQALAEAAKEISEDTILQRELEQEDAYQELLLKYKVEFNMITDEELEAIQAKKKKK